MIHFNELRITEDNKSLIIDVSVDSDSCFSDVTLDTIIIDNQNTYIDNGPSSNPILSINIKEYYTKVLTESSCEYAQVYSESQEYKCYIKDSKNIRLLINLEDYNIKSTDILFVYVISEGTPTCEIVKPYILGTVVNLYYIYTNAMNYIRETECNCSIPKNFIDFILRLKALELCIKTGNYIKAIKYWNKLNIKPSNKCCYG
jgi:hypothetical protein